MIRKSLKMIDDGPPNLSIGSSPRPEIGWCSAGDAGDTPKGRYAKFLVLLDEKSRPPPQVVEEQVELRV